MTKLLDECALNIAATAGLLAFDTPKDGDGRALRRYLTVESKPAYEIGTLCETCSFYFTRLDGANQKVSASHMSEALAQGLTSLDPAMLDTWKSILPAGTYRVTLLEIHPKLVTLGEESDYFANEQIALWGKDPFWNLPHGPKIRYYRGTAATRVAETLVCEFFIPMFPESWLEAERVAYFTSRFAQASRPTAVSLTLLDAHAPAVIGDLSRQGPVAHECLAHFLIDGHHKMYAAAQAGKPLTLLSFLSVGESGASKERIDQVLKWLKR